MSITSLVGPLMSLIKAITIKDVPGIVTASLTIVEAVAALLTPAQSATLASKHPSFSRYIEAKRPSK